MDHNPTEDEDNDDIPSAACSMKPNTMLCPHSNTPSMPPPALQQQAKQVARVLPPAPPSLHSTPDQGSGTAGNHVIGGGLQHLGHALEAHGESAGPVAYAIAPKSTARQLFSSGTTPIARSASADRLVPTRAVDGLGAVGRHAAMAPQATECPHSETGSDYSAMPTLSMGWAKAQELLALLNPMQESLFRGLLRMFLKEEGLERLVVSTLMAIGALNIEGDHVYHCLDKTKQVRLGTRHFLVR